MFVDLISYLLIESEVLFLGFTVLYGKGMGMDDWRCNKIETFIFVLVNDIKRKRCDISIFVSIIASIHIFSTISKYQNCRFMTYVVDGSSVCFFRLSFCFLDNSSTDYIDYNHIYSFEAQRLTTYNRKIGCTI